MAKIEIQVDDGVLSAAERILHSLGMDVEMAVSIYLRRIALENRLPMSMTGPVSRRTEPETTEELEYSRENESTASSRSNSKITTAMVDEVWRAFLRHIEAAEEINPLSTEVSLKTGMNRGSVFIYLTVLCNLVNGEPNTRVLKYKDLEYVMGKIETELGKSQYQNALKSLMASVPYWREKIPGAFANKVEAYCKKNLSK